MRKTAIYGAGEYGRRLAECYKVLGQTIDMFLISKREKETRSELGSIPIRVILEMSEDECRKLDIIVATDERHHRNIREILTEKLGECDCENVKYLSKEEMNAVFRKAYPIKRENEFLCSIQPVSRLFGNDRGTPIDRYYIEQFLEENGDKCTGNVLEVGEDTYSKRYFPNYHCEVLEYCKGMDLTKKETLPFQRYDRFICTQVFHQIYDVKSAIEGAYYLLKNNGVLLATVCGNITKLAQNDEYKHYWGFTKRSIENLIKDVFGDNVTVTGYGNCMAATAFIQGIALEEVNVDLLEECDEEYTICLSIVAKKKEK